MAVDLNGYGKKENVMWIVEQIPGETVAIGAGSAGHEHAHVLLMQRGGGHLAVDGAEVSGLLLEEIIASGDGLRATSPAAPRAWGSSRRAGPRGSCWSA